MLHECFRFASTRAVEPLPLETRVVIGCCRACTEPPRAILSASNMPSIGARSVWIRFMFGLPRLEERWLGSRVNGRAATFIQHAERKRTAMRIVRVPTPNVCEPFRRGRCAVRTVSADVPRAIGVASPHNWSRRVSDCAVGELHEVIARDVPSIMLVGSGRVTSVRRRMGQIDPTRSLEACNLDGNFRGPADVRANLLAATCSVRRSPVRTFVRSFECGDQGRNP